MRLTRGGKVVICALLALAVAAALTRSVELAVAAGALALFLLVPAVDVAPLKWNRGHIVDKERPPVGRPPRFDGPTVDRSPEVDAEAWRRERERRRGEA